MIAYRLVGGDCVSKVKGKTNKCKYLKVKLIRIVPPFCRWIESLDKAHNLCKHSKYTRHVFVKFQITHIQLCNHP